MSHQMSRMYNPATLFFSLILICIPAVSHSTEPVFKKKAYSDIEIGDIDGKNSSTGMAIARAVGILRKAEALENFIILVTDGNVRDQQEISFEQAALICNQFNIKVFPILITKNKIALVSDTGSIERYVKVEFEADLEGFQKIAKTTGGSFYQCSTAEEFRKILQNIFNN